MPNISWMYARKSSAGPNTSLGLNGKWVYGKRVPCKAWRSSKAKTLDFHLNAERYVLFISKLKKKRVQ